MGKLTYVLATHLRQHPLQLHFKRGSSLALSAQHSEILLCTYDAIGFQYYKYTYDGTNIIFINLMPVVFFTIFDEYVLTHVLGHDSKLTSPAVIFSLGLTSVIPLSYFIGMAVSSISAQSSLGMGAVINATFGSIIEIILYSVALTQGKGLITEGALIGSFLAGLLLMPGFSMMSGAIKKKEQKFNAKSAGKSVVPRPCVENSLCLTCIVTFFNNPRFCLNRCNCHDADHVANRSPDAHSVLYNLRTGKTSCSTAIRYQTIGCTSYF
jgi:Ca2+:H+ antiporter